MLVRRRQRREGLEASGTGCGWMNERAPSLGLTNPHISCPRAEFVTMCIAVKFILAFIFIKYHHQIIISLLFITSTHIAFTLQLGTVLQVLQLYLLSARANSPGYRGRWTYQTTEESNTLQTLAHAEAMMYTSTVNSCPGL